MRPMFPDVLLIGRGLKSLRLETKIGDSILLRNIQAGPLPIRAVPGPQVRTVLLGWVNDVGMVTRLMTPSEWWGY